MTLLIQERGEIRKHVSDTSSGKGGKCLATLDVNLARICCPTVSQDTEIAVTHRLSFGSTAMLSISSRYFFEFQLERKRGNKRIENAA